MRVCEKERESERGLWDRLCLFNVPWHGRRDRQREVGKGNGTGKESWAGQGWDGSRKRGMRLDAEQTEEGGFSPLCVCSATRAPWLASFLPLLYVCLLVIRAHIQAVLHMHAWDKHSSVLPGRALKLHYKTTCSHKETGWMVTTPFVCWCACVQLSVVVPLGGWISRRMAIILISTNYVCYQLTTQLARTSFPVFLSRSFCLPLNWRNTPHSQSPSLCSAADMGWAEGW